MIKEKEKERKGKERKGKALTLYLGTSDLEVRASHRCSTPYLKAGQR